MDIENLKVGGGDRAIERQQVFSPPKPKIKPRRLNIGGGVKKTGGGHDGGLLDEIDVKSLKAGGGDQAIGRQQEFGTPKQKIEPHGLDIGGGLWK